MEIKLALGFVRQLVRKFERDEGSLLAAAISFNILLCAAPLLLLFVSVFGYLFVNFESVSREILAFFDRTLPLATPQVVRELERITSHRGVVGLVGILGLAWTSTRLFGSLRLALDRVFEAEWTPGYLVGKLIDFLTLFLVAILLLLSISLTSSLNSLRESALRALGFSSPELRGLWHLLGFGLGFLLTASMFWVLYQAAPHRRLRLRTSLTACLYASVAWESAKLGFDLFFRKIGVLGTVYGSVGVFLIFLSWIYLSTLIFIVAGEAAWTKEKVQADLVEGGHDNPA